MKITEKPILFFGEMVRAILDGRKSMTRRVVKPQPEVMYESTRPELWQGDNRPLYKESFATYCPYGIRGQRLWVRETWGLHDTEPKDGPDGAHVYFRATNGDRHELRYQRWRPSIHMPRWASRLTLEITDIRVECLQEISESDALAEGFENDLRLVNDHTGSLTPGEVGMTAVGNFKDLWDTLNEKRGFGWDQNPWVWVIEFKRLEEA